MGKSWLLSMTNEKHPEMSFSEQVTYWPETEQMSKSLQSEHFLWLFVPNEFLAAIFLPKWHLYHIYWPASYQGNIEDNKFISPLYGLTC